MPTGYLPESCGDSGTCAPHQPHRFMRSGSLAARRESPEAATTRKGRRRRKMRGRVRPNGERGRHMDGGAGYPAASA